MWWSSNQKLKPRGMQQPAGRRAWSAALQGLVWEPRPRLSEAWTFFDAPATAELRYCKYTRVTRRISTCAQHSTFQASRPYETRLLTSRQTDAVSDEGLLESVTIQRRKLTWQRFRDQ